MTPQVVITASMVIAETKRLMGEFNIPEDNAHNKEVLDNLARKYGYESVEQLNQTMQESLKEAK